MTVYFQPVQDVQISTQSSRSQYQYTLTGTDAVQVALWSQKLVAEMRRDPLFRDVSSEAQDGGLRAALDINRQRAGQLGRGQLGHRRGVGGVHVGLVRVGHRRRLVGSSGTRQRRGMIGRPIERLRVDGGAAENDLLMELQAGLSGVSVERIIASTYVWCGALAGVAGHRRGVPA